MKTLLITKFDSFPELPSPLTDLPLMDFSQLIINHEYDTSKFIQNITKEDVRTLRGDETHNTNQSTDPFIFRTIREVYKLKKDIVVVPSVFLTSKEINYLVDVLHNKVNIIFVTIKKNKVLFVNPYNANYFIYDAFTSPPLLDIIEQLNKKINKKK